LASTSITFQKKITQIQANPRIWFLIFFSFPFSIEIMNRVALACLPTIIKTIKEDNNNMIALFKLWGLDAGLERK
jgi:hypothetical protein